VSNASQLKITLDELKRTGRLEKIDSAWVQAVKSMAVMLDQNPSNAALWGRYLEALGALTVDDGDDSFDEALDQLYGTVRDSPPS
jgi:hypothetical protein